MSEKLSRTACLEDFIGNTNHDKTQSQNDKTIIAKNQKEFGNRKRITP